MSIDLHGYTVHAAWKKFRSHTEQCYRENKKSTIVITGHGIMSTEFPGWCDADPFVTGYKRMDPNTGSWHLSIKKSKKNATAIVPPKTIVDYAKLLRKYSK